MKKSILITGASSGMGLADTIFFAQNNYQVFATYRTNKDEEKLKKIKNVYPIKMDIANADDIQQAFEQVSSMVGNDGLFAIINNAGIMYTAPFEYADEKRARQMIEVNLMAPYKITQTFIPLLKKHNAKNDIKARVINIASWAGYIGQPFIPFYNASKAGLIGLSESMYYDLGLLDIHVVLASPGVTRTPMLGKATEDGKDTLQALPKEGRDFYKPYLDNIRTMGEGAGNSKFLPTADVLAKKLYKIVESKRPKHKYNLAMDAAFMDKIMTKIIPLSWRFALNKSMYKLNIKNPAKALFQKASVQDENSFAVSNA
ncbi:MAG TPA: SDR family NAD(P)-dependent oxidoreductase [Bacteroidia bacterium]|nr:SDR family NAD(P)-dependent oxidoreductase [Bacteroidia bacterium]